MPFSRISGVIVIALLGMVIAAAITYTASTLVSQPIGLTSEPATLGKGLAPSPTPPTPPRTVTVTTTTPTATTPTGTNPTGTTPVVPAPITTTPTAAGDDHGGRSDGDADDD